MDVDPLADSVPPRYAVESDDEDEYNPLETTKTEPPPPPEIKIVGQIPPNRPLVLASGAAGKYWAKGTRLGEQSGGIYVQNVQVGLLFSPSWSNSTIVVSETLTRLPIIYMHSYVEAMVDELKPSTVSVLDIYPTPTYVSAEPIALQDAPIRYLSTGVVDKSLSSVAQPFSPPNFVHSSTSSALLSFFASNTAIKATLFLLPYPRTIPLPPKTLEPSDFSHLSEDEVQWSEMMMNEAQNSLFLAVGENVKSKWNVPSNSRQADGAFKSNKPPVDGGMYI